jgi:hypothetical protein
MPGRNAAFFLADIRKALAMMIVFIQDTAKLSPLRFFEPGGRHV